MFIKRNKNLLFLFFLYLLFIFLPGIWLVHVSDLLTEDVSPAITAPIPLEQTLETSSTIGNNNNVAEGNTSLFSPTLNSPLSGFFGSCLITDCTEISVHRNSTMSENSKTELLVTPKTTIYCVKEGSDNIGFSPNELEPLLQNGTVKKLSFSKLTNVLKSYQTGKVFLYQLANNNLSLFAVFYPNCDTFN